MLMFEHPQYIYLSLPLAFILIIVHYRGFKIYLKYSRFYHPLAQFIEMKKEGRRITTLLMKILLALMISIAISNPYIITKEKVVAESGVHRLRIEANPAVIVLLDASGSMGETIDGISKIDSAKIAIKRLLSITPKNIDFGVVVFENNIRLAIPITGDRDKILHMLENVTASGGTGYGPALSTALAWLKPYRMFNLSCAMVLVSDGLPGDKPGYEYILEEIAKLRIPVHTVYIGRQGEGEEEAKRIAEKTGGGHYTVSTLNEFVKAFESIGESIKELSLESEVYIEVEVKRSLSIIFYVASLVLSVLLWAMRFLTSRISF